MKPKDVILKTRLIKTIILVIIGIAVLLSGAIWASYYDDNKQSEKGQKEADSAAMHAEREAIEAQFRNSVEDNAYYNAYIKNHAENFTLNREVATQWFGVLHTQYHLVNMEVTVAPITDVPGNNLQLKTGTLVKSEIVITFGALSDSSAYGFIEAIQHQLPGMILIHDLKISRVANMSRGILTDIIQHKITPMVSCEIAFAWIGLRSKSGEQAAGEAAGIKGPGNGR